MRSVQAADRLDKVTFFVVIRATRTQRNLATEEVVGSACEALERLRHSMGAIAHHAGVGEELSAQASAMMHQLETLRVMVG